jgi:hypothetical protein
MIKNINDNTISKYDALKIIKEKIKKEKELRYRNMLSEKSFERPNWDNYLAHQLGQLAGLEELDKFIPDPVNPNA